MNTTKFLLLALLALCAIALDACRTFGNELPLFDSPPAVISGEMPLFERPVVSSAAAPCLKLFECSAPVSSDRGMLNLFSCAATPGGTCTETEPELQPIAESHPKGIAEPDPDEISFCYCPWWCQICRVQKGRNIKGVRYVEGASSEMQPSTSANRFPLLPKDVREYAAKRFAKGTVINGKDVSGQEHGYPVWKIPRGDGTWIFAHHVRSEADIAAIKKLKPGDRLPDSTFWSKDNQDQISSTAVR